MKLLRILSFGLILLSGFYSPTLFSMEEENQETEMGMEMKGCVSKLVLFPGTKAKDVPLPHPYKHVTLSEQEKIIFVPEVHYVTLNIYENDPKFALVGPCQPCLLIAVINEVNGRVIVFHKHLLNSISSVTDLICQELEITDRDKITGVIFTTTMSDYTTRQYNPSKTDTWQDMHKGRTQEQELKCVKGQICQNLNLDHHQIVAQIFTLNDYDLGDYRTAECCVFVDASQSQLKLYSVSMMHENIFYNLSHLPLDERYIVYWNRILKPSLLYKPKIAKDWT